MISTRKSHSGLRSNADVPERNRWLPTSAIVDVLGLQPGMSVAQLGAGGGDLITQVAEAIGPAGHAFAVETAPERVAPLRENTQEHRNIHVVESPHHATPIAAGSCDRVILANRWAELPDPIAALRTD